MASVLISGGSGSRTGGARPAVRSDVRAPHLRDDHDRRGEFSRFGVRRTEIAQAGTGAACSPRGVIRPMGAVLLLGIADSIVNSYTVG
jgi:hypothetical protein